MAKNHHQTGLPSAIKFALSGIVATIKRERNIKIELCFAVAALVASAVLQLQPLEWALIIILIALVLSFELANSAIESLTDLASPETHPIAKYVKDAMAGAVFLTALCSVVVGLIIFINAALRMGEVL